jgi:hypothetical protein
MRALPSLLFVFGTMTLIAALQPGRGLASPASDWLAQHCTGPGGVIRVRPGGEYVSGYFGTLVADALVRARAEPAIALAWMQWYVSHAHGSGSGIDGVPDDVDIVDGAERSRGRPDSTDAYGAVFLTLARDAYDSGDPDLRRFVLDRRDDLRRIMDSSLATMQANGLTFARPGHDIYYAIDNVQVYRGLLDASDLFTRAFHDAPTAARYERASRVIKHGIDTVLWDAQTETIRPYMNALGTSGPANLAQAYPDALAQAFAIYYGAIDPKSAPSLLERAAPALLAGPEPLDEHRLVLLAAQQRMGESVELPPFTPPPLCIDAGWYLVIEANEKSPA